MLGKLFAAICFLTAITNSFVRKEGENSLSRSVTRKLCLALCLVALVVPGGVFSDDALARQAVQDKKSEPREGKSAARLETVKEWPTDRIGSLIAEWTRAKDFTQEYLERMPEEAMNFKPTIESQSFSEIMVHLAITNFSFGAHATGQKNPYRSQELVKNEEFKRSKSALTKIVLESYDFVIGGIKKLNEATLNEQDESMKRPRSALIHMCFNHQAITRGQTFIYYRLKGIPPPRDLF